MSAQGGILERRGAVRLPMWPVAVLLVAAIATAIGMTVFTDARQDGLVTSVTDDERLANSSAAIREQGGRVLFDPAVLENSSAAIRERFEAGVRPAIDPAVLENSSAAVREQGALAYHTSGRAHEVIVGAVTTGTTLISGLENAGAYPTAGDAPAAGPHRAIVVNGEPCPQCR